MKNTHRPFRPKDINQLAKYIVDLSTGEITKPKQTHTKIKEARRGNSKPL